MDQASERDRPSMELEITADCFPNITRRGRYRRIRAGVLASIAMVVLFAWLVRRQAAPLTFLLIAPLALYTTLLFLQAREKTCVVLAARGLRELSDGRKGRIPGEWLVAVQRQTRKVWIETVAATLILTAAAVLAAALAR